MGHATAAVTNDWYFRGTGDVVLHKRANRHDSQVGSDAHIPMEHELASCPGPGFQEPAELLCASEIVDDS